MKWISCHQAFKNMKSEENKIEIKCLTPNQKWIKMYRATIERNGKSGTWEFVSRKKIPEIISGKSKADAVIIIPFIREMMAEKNCFHKLLVIKEFRYPIGDYVFSLPAGIINDGEDLIKTASRELLEETGYRIDEVIAVTPPVYSSTGLTDESTVFVYAYVSHSGPAKLEGVEDIELVPMDKEELTKLLYQGAPYEKARISCRLWTIAYSLVISQPSYSLPIIRK